MKKLLSPRLRVVVAMAIFGTIALFVRNISVSSSELALYRAVLAVIVLSALFLLTGQKIPFREIKKELPVLLLSGVAMGFNWILLFQAYKYTTVSVATLSYYFAPVLVTVACPILFKEKMGIKQWLCFIMSTLGIVLITGTGDLSSGSSHITGIFFGLCAACLYATVVLLNKFIKGVAGLHRTFLQFMAAVVVLIPYVALTSGCTLGTLDVSGWIYLLIVGLVHTGFAYCLYFSSIEPISGQEAAILSYVDPLLAILMSVWILGEEMSLVQLLGGALILGFTLWNELPSKGGKHHG